ncbi:MAG: hypothetical protein AAGB34_11030, partial [Planctomycetota bacterium]
MCHCCGYSLQATVPAYCPECGEDTEGQRWVRIAEVAAVLLRLMTVWALLQQLPGLVSGAMQLFNPVYRFASLWRHFSVWQGAIVLGGLLIWLTAPYLGRVIAGQASFRVVAVRLSPAELFHVAILCFGLWLVVLQFIAITTVCVQTGLRLLDEWFVQRRWGSTTNWPWKSWLVARLYELI